MLWWVVAVDAAVVAGEHPRVLLISPGHQRARISESPPRYTSLYIVLGALHRSPVRSQAALADAIGADKTRIIATLDELQEQGYI